MRKEHLKTAVVIGLTTSVVVAGVYLLMPDKYKEKLNAKVMGLFKKKKKEEAKENLKEEIKEPKVEITGSEAVTVYKVPDINPALK